MNAPKDIGSAAPFASAVQLYIFKGWNVLPLPPKKKQSPPGKDEDPQGLGFTGRLGRLPEQDDLDKWLNDSRWRKGNIAVRPGNVVTHDGQEWEVIGIDVDDYEEKHGLDHLRELERTYGPLPNTWTSSARADGRSGIRWFLTPIGYEYMGKPVLPSTGRASDSIEIVQRVHRYGLVYPSQHPDGPVYRWYDRGVAPDGQNWADSIPAVQQLATLPDRWFKFLTRNGIAASDAANMDMESSNEQLKQWQAKHWPEPEDMCDKMSEAMVTQLDYIENDSDHHEPLVRAHWHILRLGAEGHTGWATARKVLEQAWIERVLQEGVRTRAEAKYEVARSFWGVVRKIKGDYDDFKRRGYQYLEGHDHCEMATQWTPPPVAKAPRGPLDYERNEDGNARHFLDLYKDNIRFVVNHTDGQGRWILFDKELKRWKVDDKDVEVKHKFRRVKQRQIRAAARRFRRANRAVLVAGGASAATPSQNAELREAKAWVQFALESGNRTRVSNSLAQAQSYPNVALKYEDLDRDIMVLPCANGVIRFNTREQRLNGAKPFEFIEDPAELKRLLITQNTHVPYIPLREQKNHPDEEIRSNYKRFVQYMQTFLKEQMTAEAYDYMGRLLGLSILGVNTKKAVFLVGARDTGKSTFQRMMSSALGDLAIWRDPDIFEDTQFKSALAEALSRRVVMVGELGEKHMDASLFKRITGGDEVSCQLKNINKPVTLSARCTVISGCNSAPEVPKVDDATKERFVVIPFRHQISRATKDPHATEELMKYCRVPLLAWLVDRCADAVMSGVAEIPAELQLETQAFVSSLNELSDFINDWLVMAPPQEWDMYSRKDQTDPRDPKPRWPDEKCVGHRKLYEAYCKYTSLNNMKTESSHWFTRRMKEAGLVQDGSKNAQKETRWLGVTLVSQSRVHTKDG